jgi:hypothetical protein
MDKEESLPEQTIDPLPVDRPDEAVIAVCDRYSRCDLTLHRAILDRCVDVSSNVSSAMGSDVSAQCAVRLAHAVVKLIRTYFADVKTGLELATYVRYALLASGFSDVDAIIKDSVYGDSTISMSGGEFSEMSQQLGALILSGNSSYKFSISFRPVTLFYQGNLELSGLFMKRILEEEARSLAYEQLEASKLVTDADLIAYRETAAAKQRSIEAQEAEVIKRKKAEHQEFLRRNKY